MKADDKEPSYMQSCFAASDAAMSGRLVVVATKIHKLAVSTATK
jgi:hypothetical protein